MTLKYLKGDLIQYIQDGNLDVIVHGCNCFHIMGGGIAKQIKNKFPEVFVADQETPFGDINKLGLCHYIQITNPSFIIVNAYTQYHYGTQQVNVDYYAIRKCMQSIKINMHGLKIGMPKIGCGLAGGDWNIVSKIIETELTGEDVTIMYLE